MHICDSYKNFGNRLSTHLPHYSTKIEASLNEIRNTVRKTNPGYDLVIKRLHLYYDMEVVTFDMDSDTNLIIQFMVFIQPYTQQLLILYQIETVSVAILDKNTQAHSYTHLQVDRPYIALNTETYITIRQQELRTCKAIGYKFYCKELFLVKHKSKYSCRSAIYFDLDAAIIKENCKFDFYYNKRHISLSLYLMVGMKSYYQTGITSISHVVSTMTFQSGYPVICMYL